MENEFRVAVRTLLGATGDDTNRDGLRETPQRVERAFKEWFDGYGQDPATLFKVFENSYEDCDEMVLVANIPLHSFCEHHMAPFWGLAHIAYLPTDGHILGLSKFARLVNIFAHRLQVQERLTKQIAACIDLNLSPRGLGVVLECRHMCIESRGVRARGTITTTSAVMGAVRKDPAARAEFLSLVRSASRAKEGV